MDTWLRVRNMYRIRTRPISAEYPIFYYFRDYWVRGPIRMHVGYEPAQQQAMLSPNAPDAGTPATSRRLPETQAVTHASSRSPAAGDESPPPRHRSINPPSPMTAVSSSPSLFSLLDLLYCCLISLLPTEASVKKNWCIQDSGMREEILLVHFVILAFSKWLTSPPWSLPLDEPELQAVSFGLGDVRLDVEDENETNEEIGTWCEPECLLLLSYIYLRLLYLGIWELKLETCCSIIIELKSRLQCFIFISVLISVVIFLFLNSKMYMCIGFLGNCRICAT